MRNILLVISFFCFKNSFGQSVNISSSKNNVIYANVDNPLYITAGNYTSEEIIVQVNKGTLSKGYGGIYNFQCVETGGIIFSVYFKTDSKLLGTYNFRSKAIPLPSVTIFPSDNGDVKLSTLQSLKAIGLSLENFDFDVRYSLDSFSVTKVTKTNGMGKELVNRTSFLSKEILNELISLKPGDVFLVSKAFTTNLNGLPVLLKPAVFTVIE